MTGLADGGVAHVLTHGLAGGILAELQGGQFGHGFLAAGLSKAVMGRFSYKDVSTPGSAGQDGHCRHRGWYYLPHHRGEVC